IAAKEEFKFTGVDHLGKYTTSNDTLEKHIAAILSYPLVDINAIKKAKFKVVVDAINSTGAIAVPELLKALGVK
ncbi:hypothetical protein, partial [Stenotrophomonas maltophilia]|uniref:hypothetical protein n=1 Tax=Stenotrophomonas maltophilia TaxID=40324 RepID=UPI001953E2BD